MKKRSITVLFGAIFLLTGFNNVFAQQTKAADMFKNHINKVVQKVKRVETSQKKRKVLNHSFNKMLKAFNKVSNMRMLSESDQAAIKMLSHNIRQKKYELNGTHGFKRVPDSQLNNFANYVLQDIEQAGSITISVTVLLLILILVVLLLAV